MVIGTIYPKESKIRKDLTLNNNYPVIQITNNGKFNVPQYFTHQSWTKENELIFVSFRQNNSDLYKFNVNTHEITQLTDKMNVAPYSFSIAPSNDFLIYFGGVDQEEIYKLNLKSYESEYILTRPQRFEGWSCVIPEIAPNNDSFFICSNPSDGTGGALFRGSIKKGTYEMIDHEILNSKNTLIYHQNICPSDPNLIELDVVFTSGPYSKKFGEQRMWLYDQKENSLRKILKQKKGFFSKYQRVCHESWMPDGKNMLYIVRRDKLCKVSIEDEFGKENG
jgi:hypothetical protein